MGFTVKEKAIGNQKEITVTDSTPGKNRSARFFDNKLFDLTLDGNTLHYSGNEEAHMVKFANGNSVSIHDSSFLGPVVDITVNGRTVRDVPLSDIGELNADFRNVYNEANKLKLKADQCLAEMAADTGVRRNNHLQAWVSNSQNKLNSRIAQAQQNGNAASHGTQGNRRDDHYDENIDVALGKTPDYDKANKDAAKREEAIRQEIRKQQQRRR